MYDTPGTTLSQILMKLRLVLSSNCPLIKMPRVASSTSKELCAYVMGFITISRDMELKIPLDRFVVSSTHFEQSSLPELFAQQVFMHRWSNGSLQEDRAGCSGNYIQVQDCGASSAISYKT